jgi:uncharacterized protein YxjI
MRYQMKQRMWSWTDAFIVRDEADNEVYRIDGAAFALGHKLSFQDAAGSELAYIAQKLLSFKTRYDIYRDGDLFAEVIKDFTLFNQQYTVDIPGPNDYAVQGDFWNYEYTFIRSDQEVAQVSKKFFALTDTYGVEIADDEDPVTILATAVVIDLVNQDRHQRG